MSAATDAPSLGRLLEIQRLARSGDDLQAVLRDIARLVGETCGFATVAVNLRRPAWDDFEVVAVHGNPGAAATLLGTTQSGESWERFLHPRFLARGAYVVDGRTFDWSEAHGTYFTPDLAESDDPGMWHPLDALFVPMQSDAGELLGIISLDEPRDGRRPSNDVLDILVAAGQAATHSVEAATRAAEERRLSDALHELVSLSDRFSTAASSDEILTAVCDGVCRALGFEKVAAEVLDLDTGVFEARASSGWGPGETTVHTRLTAPDVQALIAPALLRGGCSLLEPERALELVTPSEFGQVSTRNGTSARAWRRHWLLVPLLARGERLLGFLWVDDPEDCLLPSDERLHTLRMFADQATRALETAEQLRTVERRRGELAALHETALSLVEQIDSAPTLEAIVARAAELLDVEDGFLYLRAPGEERLVARVSTGLFGTAVGMSVREGEGLTGRVWAERRSIAIDDYSAWGGRVRSFDEVPLRALVAVPLFSRDEVVGVLGVAVREGSRRFAADDAELLERFARLASLALDKGRLYDALTQSRELYRGVVENSGELIALIAPDSQFVYTSPSFRTVLGYEPESLIGTSGTALMHPEDLDSIPSGVGIPYTIRIRHADGTWVLVEGVSASVPGTAGEPDLVLLTARDVTKRAVLEEELRQAQKMEAVGRLAGGIAHDFNNLMTAIGGYAELGLMRLGDAPGPHHELTQVRAAAMRASDLTRQLLAYSRKQMLDLHVLDLNEVVADTCSILERLLGGAVAVVLDLALDLGPTRADPGQISQVLLNLAINGRDAMPDGGTLTIATRNDGEGHIRLTVADTGHGMDADTLARVFEPFFTTKKVGDGTGLGLSTVHGIVHQLGGDVTAESAPGAGTTFEIVLPRADVQAVAA